MSHSTAAFMAEEKKNQINKSNFDIFFPSLPCLTL